MRKKMQLTRREMEKFEAYLRHDEREPATIEAYLCSLRKFAEWADSRAVTKELAAAWKAELVEAGYCPVSVNAMLAAVNKFFACMGRKDCKVQVPEAPAPDVPETGAGADKSGVSAPGAGGS